MDLMMILRFKILQRAILTTLLSATALFSTTVLAEQQFWGKRSAAVDFPTTKISVIISGKNSHHLDNVLQQVVRLSEDKHVEIRSVLIVGIPEKSQSDSASHLGKNKVLPPGYTVLGEPFRYLEKADIPYLQVTSAERFISSHKLEFSPTWVLKQQTETLVLEGFTNIQHWLGRRSAKRGDNAL